MLLNPLSLKKTNDFCQKFPIIVRYRTLFTVAGSDSIGGAGIEADIKTCCRFSVYAMTAISALTVQNSLGVKKVLPTSPGDFRMILETVLSDCIPDAMKIGMLPSAEHVRVVSEMIVDYNLKNIVVDPVISSSSGMSLSGDSFRTVEALREFLFPLVTIITPNIPESKILCNLDPHSDVPGYEELGGLGVDYILLKGGHSVSDFSTDRLISFHNNMSPKENIVLFTSEKISSSNLHGTGCVLSTAIACGLANGNDIYKSVKDAKEFITLTIQKGKSYTNFHGNGPLNLLI